MGNRFSMRPIIAALIFAFEDQPVSGLHGRLYDVDVSLLIPALERGGAQVPENCIARDYYNSTHNNGLEYGMFHGA